MASAVAPARPGGAAKSAAVIAAEGASPAAVASLGRRAAPSPTAAIPAMAATEAAPAAAPAKPTSAPRRAVRNSGSRASMPISNTA